MNMGRMFQLTSQIGLLLLINAATLSIKSVCAIGGDPRSRTPSFLQRVDSSDNSNSIIKPAEKTEPATGKSESSPDGKTAANRESTGLIIQIKNKKDAFVEAVGEENVKRIMYGHMKKYSGTKKLEMIFIVFGAFLCCLAACANICFGNNSEDYGRMRRKLNRLPAVE